MKVLVSNVWKKWSLSTKTPYRKWQPTSNWCTFPVKQSSSLDIRRCNHTPVISKSQILHVWTIFTCTWVKFMVNGGKDSSPMEHRVSQTGIHLAKLPHTMHMWYYLPIIWLICNGAPINFETTRSFLTRCKIPGKIPRILVESIITPRYETDQTIPPWPIIQGGHSDSEGFGATVVWDD